MVADPIAPDAAKSRFQVKEGEAAAQGEIHQHQGAVGDIHRADDIDIGRDMDALGGGAGVGQGHGFARVALVGFQQGEHLAENLRRIAPVDFLDDHHILGVRVLQGVVN